VKNYIVNKSQPLFRRMLNGPPSNHKHASRRRHTPELRTTHPARSAKRFRAAALNFSRILANDRFQLAYGNHVRTRDLRG
jgi:hypothetical protein